MNKQNLLFLIAALAVCPSLMAEIYDAPRAPSELDLRDGNEYYNEIIDAQLKAAKASGLPPGDAAIKGVTIGDGFPRVPAIPSDNAMVGREGKLDDASKMAMHGKQAAAASSIKLFNEMLGLQFSCSLGCPPHVQDELDKIEASMDLYGLNATQMEQAEFENANGRDRLLQGTYGGSLGYDDSNPKNPGGRASVQTQLSGLSEETKRLLSQAGMDPETVLNAANEAAQSGGSVGEAMRRAVDLNKVDRTLLPSIAESAGSDAQAALQRMKGIGVEAAPGNDQGNLGGGSGSGGGALAQDSLGLESDQAGNRPELAGIPLEMFPDGRRPSSGDDLAKGGRGDRQRYYGGVLEPVTPLGRFMATLNGLKKKSAPKAGTLRKISYKKVVRLKAVGVLVPRRGGHLFYTASQRYRSFGKYRDRQPLATRKPATRAAKLFAFD